MNTEELSVSGSLFGTLGSQPITTHHAKRKIASARPAWLKLTELEVPMRDCETKLKRLESFSAAELASRTKFVLKHEIGFISNPMYSRVRAAKPIFAKRLKLMESQPVKLASLAGGSDLPHHLSRLCEARLLTSDQEQALFQRMNFLRYQAALQRSALSISAPSAARLALIEQLLALADWHRDRIVEANTRLVFSIVKKFINVHNRFDDLLSDGIMALIRAVEKFDCELGFRFSTYATQVVRRNAYRELVQKQEARDKVMSGLDEMEIDLSDEERSSAISEGRWHELRSRLGLMLSDLDRREKFIIRARFSLGSHRRVHTLQSLADKLGVSKERVRQLERRALEKLRLMARDVKLVELET